MGWFIVAYFGFAVFNLCIFYFGLLLWGACCIVLVRCWSLIMWFFRFDFIMCAYVASTVYVGLFCYVGGCL